jgi:hypothetical protein
MVSNFGFLTVKIISVQITMYEIRSPFKLSVTVMTSLDAGEFEIIFKGDGDFYPPASSDVTEFVIPTLKWLQSVVVPVQCSGTHWT